jgi:DNA-binding HxlR family transcriptional regulator
MVKFDEDECIIYEVIDFLSKKWNTFILLEFSRIENGFIRYNDLKKRLVKITPRALSIRLKKLEEWNVIERLKINENNKETIVYKLTNNGKDLFPILIDLRDWGKKIKKCKLERKCDKCIFVENCIK